MKRSVLKTSELFDSYSYPEQSWSVPSWVATNDDFKDTLKDVIASRLEEYVSPSSFDELFSYLKGKQYAIFDERFVVCLSQGRLAYLTSSGFSKVSASEDVFMLENWKIHS